jgi:thiamine pyrophosphokinase
MNAAVDQRGRALLAIGGELPELEFLRILLEDYDLLVAADAAALNLHSLGIIPDVVIGDFDSITEIRHHLQELGAVMIEDADQERSDFEKAMQWLVDRGHSQIDLIGVAGGMTDHMLNNFSVIATFARDLRMRIIEPTMIAHVITGKFSTMVPPHTRISLIPLPSARLTTSGLRWNLDDETLELGLRHGASNQSIDQPLVVNVHQGTVAVFIGR